MLTAEKKCVECGKRVSLTILLINIVALVVKAFFALTYFSNALLADSLESMYNVVITLVAIVTLWIAEKKEDDKFPYGYGKIEFIASGLANAALFLGAVAFFFQELHTSFLVNVMVPHKMAIVGALFGFILNMIAYYLGTCPGEKLKSPIIIANARANKLDAYSSIVVVLAVLVANFGLPSVDQLVAILIALLFAYEALNGMIASIKELLGRTSKEEAKEIKIIVGNIEGVKQIESIKTRSVGRKIWVDINIALKNDKTIQEGLNIVQAIKETLFKKTCYIMNVSVQVVPEKTS